MQDSAATPTTQKTADLLAELLAEFGKPAPKVKAPKANTPKAKSDAELCNSYAEKFALQHTGYRVWQAVARIVAFQYRVCETCGEEHLEWVDEYYKFENGRTYATWIRHEAYGIEHAELLPVEHITLPERRQITACSACCTNPDIALMLQLALTSGQQQMELPL